MSSAKHPQECVEGDLRRRFADRFEKVLQFSEKSQAEVARHLGVTRSCVSSWCRGGSIPSLERLERLADFLDTVPSFLLGEPPSSADEVLRSPEFLRVQTALIGLHQFDSDDRRNDLLEIEDYIRFIAARATRRRAKSKREEK